VGRREPDDREGEALPAGVGVVERNQQAGALEAVVAGLPGQVLRVVGGERGRQPVRDRGAAGTAGQQDRHGGQPVTAPGDHRSPRAAFPCMDSYAFRDPHTLALGQAQARPSAASLTTTVSEGTLWPITVPSPTGVVTAVPTGGA